MKIGTVEIPFIAEMESEQETPHTELKSLGMDASVLTKHESGIEKVFIGFVLVEPWHSQNLSVDEQWEKVKTLEDNHWTSNDIDFLEYDGFLSVDSVDMTRGDDTAGIRTGVIEAFYLPYPEYTS